MKRKMTRILTVAVVFLLSVAFALPAGACVGKTLVIGSTGTLQQDILAQVLSILIAERTGTTVKVAQYDSTAAAHEALLKADLDMYVEYTGVGQTLILQGEAIADSEALYQAVKAGYNRDLNLVWLKPLGFDEPRAVSAEIPAQAAPVVRKDTLKKFPALARLINKLGGTIDAETMKGLEDEAGRKNVNEVARQFLKGGRLI